MNDLDISNNDIIDITCNNDGSIDVTERIPAEKTEKQKREEEFVMRVKEESINMVCRQTELSSEEAKIELEEVNYDYMKVLNKYFNFEKKETTNTNSINQNIYGEIRNLMDTGAKNFRVEQERNEHLQKVKDAREKIIKAQMLQAKNNREKMKEITLEKVDEDEDEEEEEALEEPSAEGDKLNSKT